MIHWKHVEKGAMWNHIFWFEIFKWVSFHLIMLNNVLLNLFYFLEFYLETTESGGCSLICTIRCELGEQNNRHYLCADGKDGKVILLVSVERQFIGAPSIAAPIWIPFTVDNVWYKTFGSISLLLYFTEISCLCSKFLNYKDGKHANCGRETANFLQGLYFGLGGGGSRRLEFQKYCSRL